MSETTEVVPAIMRELGRGATRVFRVNTGLAWVGRVVKHVGRMVTLANAQPMRAGLTNGGSDIIGWTSVTVTPEMVGRKLAVFTAVEAKAERGSVTGEQRDFLAAVSRAGGIAVVARSAQEARAGVDRFVSAA